MDRTVKISIIDGTPEMNGNVIHYFSDYTIQYEPLYSEEAKILLLIFGTLTIVFDKKSKRFLSLDAYTNKEIWKIDRNLSFPQDCPEGVLSIQEGFKDDHIESFKFVPKFYYNDNVVMIDINNHDSKFYKIGENVIVGLKDQQITSFIFKSVEFM